ncbi:unnamed protein product [Sphagnum compactum]
MKLGKISVGRFADGEVNVVVNENVRGKDSRPLPPVNETLMKLLLMISTMRRGSAKITGFFGPRVPVDNLDGGTVGVSYFGDMDLVNPVVVSPDAGGVYRAKQFGEALAKKHEVDCGLAMIVKQRAAANEIDRMDLLGSVHGCDVIIVDDMVNTAGTLCKAAEVSELCSSHILSRLLSRGCAGPQRVWREESVRLLQPRRAVWPCCQPHLRQRRANRAGGSRHDRADAGMQGHR